MIKTFQRGDMSSKDNFDDIVNLFLGTLERKNKPYKLHVTATGSSSRYITVVVEY